MTSSPVRPERESKIPGIILGMGLGGFVDGIALHQIAQWHNMASAIVPPTTLEAMHRNMAWDGWFHVATLLLTSVGIYWLLGDARRPLKMPSVRRFTGQLILGWGIFNSVEGLINHHLLNLHHVRDMPVHVPLYDWIFLFVGGVVFISVGVLMSHAGVTSRTRKSQNYP